MKKTIRKNMILSFALASTVLASGGVMALNGVTGQAEAVEGKGTINVYLIGGQSNAVGYGEDTNSTLANSDARYTNGFDNVLYYGEQERLNGEAVDAGFQPVKLGLGRENTRSGAEIGIASALGDTDTMNAVIKCAWGATAIYPETSTGQDFDISWTRGTWTSPSYIEENNIDLSANPNIGVMYEWFVDTVTTAIAMLEADGYTPVIKGMWWMQGEAEMWSEENASQYDELLTALIKDVRADVSEITGSDCSEMPFVFGLPTWNTTSNPDGKPTYQDAVRENMTAVANNETLINVSAVDCIVNGVPLAQHDNWHFSAEGQKYLGEQFIGQVNAAESNNVSFKESLSMFQGAKIRTSDPIGIRFGAKIADYNADNGYKYGMLIVPTDYLTTYKAQIEAANYNYVKAFADNNVDVANMTCYVNTGDSDSDGIIENYIQGSLVGIKYDNLNRPFTGIGYIYDETTNTYLYTSASVSRSVSYVASAAMLDYEETDAIYQGVNKYVNGGINQKLGNAESYEKSEAYGLTAPVSVKVDKGTSLNLGVTQNLDMGYVIGYTSANEAVATVDENGKVTGVSVGETTITVQSVYLSQDITVTVEEAPVLDGVIEEKYYTDGYMYYGNSDVDIYTYTYTSNSATYLALDVVAPTTITNNRGGVIFMVKNNKTGEGIYHRAYGNGKVLTNSLANLAASDLSWKGFKTGTSFAVDYMGASYVGTTDAASKFTVEFQIDFSEFGAMKAGDMSFVLGWIASNGTEWAYDKENGLTRLDDSAEALYTEVVIGGSYWYTLSDIDSNKTVSAIRLDGFLDEAYTNNYMHYARENGTAGYADIYAYTYTDTDAVYVALNVVGDTTITENRGGVIFMVRNTNGDGYAYRAFANGTAYYSPLSALSFYNTIWNGFETSLGGSGWTPLHLNYMNSNYVGTTEHATSFVIEFKIGFDQFSVTQASDLSFVLGWINGDGGEYGYSRNTGLTQLDANPALYKEVADEAATSKNYWFTLADIEARKATDTAKTIKLDGEVDSTYANSFEYSYTELSETTKTRLYWYEDTDALYLAFDVTAGIARTIKNTESGTQGNAGINFAVTKKGTQDGYWHRAFGTSTQRIKISDVATNRNLWTNVEFGRTDYIRGNEGAAWMATRSDCINSYVIEVRLDYADYGVTSADELSILIGGQQMNNWADVLYGRDGSRYVLTDTGGTEVGQIGCDHIGDVNGIFYWTVSDFEAQQKAQKANKYMTKSEFEQQTATYGTPNTWADTRMRIVFSTQMLAGTEITFKGDANTYAWAVNELIDTSQNPTNNGYDSGWITGTTYTTKYNYTPVLVIKRVDGSAIGLSELYDIHSMFEVSGLKVSPVTANDEGMLTEEEYNAQAALFGNVYHNILSNRVRISFAIKMAKDTKVTFLGDASVYDWAVCESASSVNPTGVVDSGWIMGTTYTTTVNGSYLVLTLKKIDNSNFAQSELANLHSLFKVEGTKVVSVSTEYETNSVAHRGYSTTAPENTLAAYRLAAEKGFAMVECDVQFTSDGYAVLLHDDTIDRTSDGSGSISAMTLEQARAYDYGSWKSSAYAGEKIPTFDEFMALCKELGLHPYIEIKSTLSAEYAQKLIDTVNKYEMIDNVTWISFGSASLAEIVKLDDTARVGYVVSEITENAITTANTLKTNSNEVFIDAYYTLDETEINLCKNASLALEVWTVDSMADLVDLDSYVSGVTSDWIVAGMYLG